MRHLILPRPSVGETPSISGGPIVVAGMFKTASGIGQSARSCVEALQDRGIDPIVVDLSDAFNQSDVSESRSFDRMPSARTGTLILHANAPETESALLALGLRRWHDWRIIGCWAWELTEPPGKWLKAARYLSEVWTPSEFVTDVFQRHLHIPVKTVPLLVRTPDAREIPGSVDSDTLKVLSMADGRSSFHRKNVLASIRMFQRAFDTGQNAELMLKFRNLDEFPQFRATLTNARNGDERIKLVNASVPSDERWRMIAQSDILISPHRSEGFGLHLAEAMALGGCVMATGWSGNTDFMSEKNSAVLPFELEPATDPFGVYDPPQGSVWARVDEDAGIETLRALAANPDERTRLGAQARIDIRASLNGDAYAEALKAS